MKNLIYGKNSVLDALKANFPIAKIYLQKGLVNKAITFKNIGYLSIQEMNQLVKNGNHQGYIAEIYNYQYYDLGTIFKDKPNLVLMLDHIQDPHNFGAIIRNANGFGIKHIIIPKNRACEVTPTVLKISSGAFTEIKIIRVGSLFDTLKELQKNGFWIYSSTLDDKATKLNKTKFATPTCLIVGNEESGVSHTLIKHSDALVYIEQKGTVQSLNVASATAVLLYEATKEN